MLLELELDVDKSDALELDGLLLDVLLDVLWLLLLSEEPNGLLLDRLDVLLLMLLELLSLWLLVLVLMLELDSLESEVLDQELELTELDELDSELDWLLELELDRSSIERICSRFTWSDAGPGNCRLPVLKCSTSPTLTSPLARVSVRTASQITFRVMVTVTSSVPPARFTL